MTTNYPFQSPFVDIANKLLERLGTALNAERLRNDFLRDNPESLPLLESRKSELSEKLVRIQAENTRYVGSVCDTYGFPYPSRIGADAYRALRYIVMSSPASTLEDLKIIRRCLDVVQPCSSGA